MGSEWTRGGLAAVVAIAVGCSMGEEVQPLDSREILRAESDARGVLYKAEGQHPPALLLVSDQGRSERDWDRFARHAQRQGYFCFAVPLQMTGKGPGAGIAEQLDEGLDYLVQRGADPENLAAVGAGAAANAILEYAVDHPALQAVVLISPGLEYGGIKAEPAMTRYGKRPVMLLYATGDAYSATSAQRLHEVAQGYAELREYQGSAHGADLFEQSEHAMEQVFVWLEPILEGEQQSVEAVSTP